MRAATHPPYSARHESSPASGLDAPAGDAAYALTRLVEALGIQAAREAWATTDIEATSTGAANAQG